MISKELYISSVDILKRVSDYMDSLRALGIDIDCKDDSPLTELQCQLMQVLEQCTGDEADGYGTMLQYFCYDRDFGRRTKDYPCMWDKDEKVIPFKTAEDVWNIVTNNS